jgi:hypothetical protein
MSTPEWTRQLHLFRRYTKPCTVLRQGIMITGKYVISVGNITVR